jgi:tape measure domain-containing protein
MASSLIVRIGADLTALQDSLKQAENRLKRFGFKAERIGRDLTTRVSLPIIGIGAAAVSTFAEFDRLEKGLAALSGGAAGGAAAFQRLNAIVLDTRTTLDLKTAALGEQRLVGAGLAAAEAERTIKQLGIAATVSGSSIDDVGGVIRQFTQIIGKGKIEQEDLNTILDRMPALGALIKEEFGASTAEGIRATGISMEEFSSRITDAIETNESFQGVQGGLAKSFESFANAVQVGIKPLGEAIAKTLNLEANLAKLGAFIGRASQAFADLNPNVQKFIIFSAAAAAATGPLFLGLGAVARTIPLLASGFGVLLGPVGKLASGIGFLGSTAKLLFSGGSIGRAIVMTKAIKGLQVAIAVLTGPVGLIVAGIALLVAGFVAAYKNSEFFRFQLDRVAQAFLPITDYITRLVSDIIPDFSFSLEGIGKVFNIVLAAIGGGISFLIEGFLALVNTVVLVAGAISDVFSGDFQGAGEKLSQTLFNPQVLARTAAEAATAAVTVFNQTADGAIDNTAFGRVIPRSTSPLDPTLTTTTGGGGSGAGSATSAVDALKDFEPATISDKARDGIASYFNEFVVGSRSVDLLQSKLKNLSITPVNVGSLDKLAQTKEIFSEMAQEIRDNLGVALEETNEKSRFFGEGFDAVSEKIKLTTDALKQAYEEGFLPTDEIVIKLKESLDALKEKQDAVTTKFGEMSSALEALQSVSATAFESVAQAMSKGASAAQAFGSAIVSAVRDAIAAEIKLAVATQVASALASVPFPFNVALAAAAGAGASALFSSALGALNIPLLAEGGITQGAGLFVAGEAGPEAIIPLDRLNEFMRPSGNDVNVSGSFELTADSLIALIRRAEPQFNRAY